MTACVLQPSGEPRCAEPAVYEMDIDFTLAGLTYRSPPLDAAARMALVQAVHAALSGLGLEAWARVPTDVFAPNLGRAVTDRAWRDR